MTPRRSGSLAPHHSRAFRRVSAGRSWYQADCSSPARGRPACTSRPKLVDPLEHRLFGVVADGASEEVENTRVVRSARNLRIQEQCLDLGCETKAASDDRVIERLDAESITGAEQLLAFLSQTAKANMPFSRARHSCPHSA